jgi:hypothetical protein
VACGLGAGYAIIGGKMADAIKPEIKHITPDDMFKLDVNDYYPEKKEDGMLMYYINGMLFSDRMINNTSKYPHIARELSDFPKGIILVGEMHIQNGNVFDVNTKANFSKARYCIFDIIQYDGVSTKDNPIEERWKLIESLFEKYGQSQEMLERPYSEGTYKDMWAEVEANNWEGLVLKPKGSKYGVGWLKCKRLLEIKIRILAYDPKENNSKGAFILENGSRCDALSQAYVQQFADISARGKTAIAEVEYPFLTKDGHLFQPRLRQITEV